MGLRKKLLLILALTLILATAAALLQAI